MCVVLAEVVVNHVLVAEQRDGAKTIPRSLRHKGFCTQHATIEVILGILLVQAKPRHLIVDHYKHFLNSV